MSTADAEPGSEPPASPSGLLQAVPAAPRLLGFDALNAMNFQIALGTPLILMAHHWGASKLYIGVLTALVPLLTLLQLYMAPRIEYIGFRRVILSGWSGRNIMLGLVALLPLFSGVLSHSILLAILFLLMLGFNTMRGLATAGWMPWLSWLIPQAWRGRYLSIQQMAVNISSAFSFFLCGVVLGESSGDYRFAILYFISFVAGWGSLAFLRTVECPPSRPGRPASEPIRAWAGRVWRERPIRRLLRVNAGYAFSIGAWLAFTTLFLREDLKLSEEKILYMGGANTLGGLASAYLWGHLADRFSSRPVMVLATRLLMLVMICWLLLTLGIFPHGTFAVVTLYVLAGIGMVGFTVAQTRYCMNNAPEGSAVLAMTLFTVASSASLALAPVIWGSVLDLLAGVRLTLFGLTFGPFSAFYGLTCLVLLGTKWLIRQLPDFDAHPTHVVLYHMITDYPLRTLNTLYKALLPRGNDNGDRD